MGDGEGFWGWKIGRFERWIGIGCNRRILLIFVRLFL